MSSGARGLKGNQAPPSPAPEAKAEELRRSQARAFSGSGGGRRGTQDATPRARGCNPTRRRLQPHAPEAASPCAQVSDEGVSCLAQLCRLKRLDLGGAPLVSQRALHALQAALPS